MACRGSRHDGVGFPTDGLGIYNNREVATGGYMTTNSQNLVLVDTATIARIEAIEDNYSYHVLDFTRWLRSHSRPFDEASVADYIRELNQSDYAASTKILKRQAVKKRIKQMMRDTDYETYARVQQFLERLDENFETRAAKVSTVAVGHEKVIDKTEARRMIHEATPRQACFIRFLWETGCRVSELTGIKKGHVLEKGETTVTIRVTGKGRKERKVKITRQLYNYVQETFRGELYLFETGGCKPYDRSYISDQIRRVARKAINRKLSAHCLRHSFATRKIEKYPAYIPDISRYLGHSNVSITLSMYNHNMLSADQLLDDALLFDNGGDV